MSNSPIAPPAGLGIGTNAVPASNTPEGTLIGDMHYRTEEYEMPDGRVAKVGFRIGVNAAGDPQQRARQRQEFLETVDPNSLTEALEKDIARLQAQFDEITHYDRDGNPVLRVQGKDRYSLEMKLASRKNSLRDAQMTRKQAELAQQARRRDAAERDARIEAAAQAKAAELLEQEHIDRRANVLAAQERAKRS